MKVREQYSTDNLLSLALRSVARSECRFNLRGLASLNNDIPNESMDKLEKQQSSVAKSVGFWFFNIALRLTPY